MNVPAVCQEIRDALLLKLKKFFEPNARRLALFEFFHVFLNGLQVCPE
jgi:hypothetical protein